MSSYEKITAGKEKPLLLFSPLDWGFGHTTRSVSLLRQWLSQGARVIVACNSTQKAILEAELTGLEFVPLEGYGIRYGTGPITTRAAVGLQVPKILIRINREQRWLRRFLAKTPVDFVISDNRYGFFSRKTPSVFITHQLQVRTGLGRLADNLVRRVLHRFINRFTECWVPDAPHDGLAGELSHPSNMPALPVVYIGLLSRFEPVVVAPQRYRYCGLLSGPEPQRSVFESIILRVMAESNVSCMLIRGLPLNAPLIDPPANITVINYAASAEIQQIAAASEHMICRAGYSSIMDMIRLGKKTIIVPTPGQGEQEYLGEWLDGKYAMQCIQQKELSHASVQAACEKFEL